MSKKRPATVTRKEWRMFSGGEKQKAIENVKRLEKMGIATHGTIYKKTNPEEARAEQAVNELFKQIQEENKLKLSKENEK